METTQMCRCCATEGSFKDIKNPYYWMGEEEVYGDMLRECFDVKMSSPEHGGICEVCITQLRNAVNFRKQVITTEERFKKLLDDIKFKATIVKEEISADDEDKFESEDNGNQDDDEDYVPEYDIPIKTETLEVKPKKRASTAKATTSKGKRSKKSEEKTESLSKKRNIIVLSSRPHAPIKVISKRNTELLKHQHNANMLLRCTNSTPIGRYGGKGYACSYCTEQLPSPSLLKEHTLQSHDSSEKAGFMSYKNLISYIVKLDITDLHCTLCSAPFPTLDAIIDHLVKQHDQTYYNDIKNHIVPFDFETEFKCALCPKEFNNFKILLMHMNSHCGNFFCEACGQKFVNHKLFESHAYRHAKNNVTCAFCDKVFDNRVKCRAHERSLHKMNNLRSKCGYCGERFNDYTKKNEHMVKEHGARPLVLNCTACDRTFDNQRALNAHKKNHHLLERRPKKTL